MRLAKPCAPRKTAFFPKGKVLRISLRRKRRARRIAQELGKSPLLPVSAAILAAHPALAPAAMPAVGRMAPAPPVAGMVGPCISGAGERIGRTRIHHPRRRNHDRRSHPDRNRGRYAPGQQQHTRYDGDRFHLTAS